VCSCDEIIEERELDVIDDLLAVLFRCDHIGERKDAEST
jgi:hypothetical protein